MRAVGRSTVWHDAVAGSEGLVTGLERGRAFRSTQGDGPLLRIWSVWFPETETNHARKPEWEGCQPETG